MKTKNRDNIKIRVTGWPVYIFFGLLPLTVGGILFFSYLLFTSHGDELDNQLFISMLILFPVLYLISFFFGRLYTTRVYEIENDTLVCSLFSEKYSYDLKDMCHLTKYKPNASHSPAFVIFFKTPEKDEYIQVMVMCLLSKESKRLYDILTEILKENNRTDSPSPIQKDEILIDVVNDNNK